MNSGVEDCFKPSQVEQLKSIYPEWRIRLDGLERHYRFGYCSDSNNLLPYSFRERVLFDVNDAHGNIIGYAGRSVKGKMPKYLNQAGYPKGKTLFNLYKLDKDTEEIWLVEGIFDAMRGYAHGYPTTALEGVWASATQIALLSKFKTIVLALDNDSAGKLATIITYFGIIAVCRSKIKWVDYGEHKDLDEFITKGETIPVAQPFGLPDLMAIYKAVDPSEYEKYKFVGDAYNLLASKLGTMELAKNGLVKPPLTHLAHHEKYKDYYS